MTLQGIFGRIGSIYDMLNHAEQEGSRVAVNAWGLNGNYGAYTADSRSVDVFVHDNPEFLPIFSAGDDPGQNASKVMAPSTGKMCYLWVHRQLIPAVQLLIFLHLDRLWIVVLSQIW